MKLVLYFLLCMVLACTSCTSGMLGENPTQFAGKCYEGTLFPFAPPVQQKDNYENH
jgi:hypothetical protein